MSSAYLAGSIVALPVVAATTVATLRGGESAHYVDGAIFAVTAAAASVSAPKLYRWDPASVLADDGVFVVKPSDAGTGRLRALTFTDADIATNAAIAGSKIVADFTGQTVIATSLTTTGNASFGGDVLISGDLTVLGTTTTTNSTVLDIANRFVHVNVIAGANVPVPTLISGIGVERGAVSGTQRPFASWAWVEGTAEWQAIFTKPDDSAPDAAGPVAVYAKGLRLADLATGTAGVVHSSAIGVLSNSAVVVADIAPNAPDLAIVTNPAGTAVVWSRVQPGGIQGGTAANQIFWWNGTSVAWSGSPWAATSVAVGASPALSGAVRISNGEALSSRSDDGVSDVSLISMRTDGHIEVGDEAWSARHKLLIVHAGGVIASHSGANAAGNSYVTFGIESVAATVGKHAQLTGQILTAGGSTGGDGIVASGAGAVGVGSVRLATGVSAASPNGIDRVVVGPTGAVRFSTYLAGIAQFDASGNIFSAPVPAASVAPSGTNFQVLTTIGGATTWGGLHVDQAAALAGMGADDQIAVAESGKFAWSPDLTFLYEFNQATLFVGRNNTLGRGAFLQLGGDTYGAALDFDTTSNVFSMATYRVPNGGDAPAFLIFGALAPDPSRAGGSVRIQAGSGSAQSPGHLELAAGVSTTSNDFNADVFVRGRNVGFGIKHNEQFTPNIAGWGNMNGGYFFLNALQAPTTDPPSVTVGGGWHWYELGLPRWYTGVATAVGAVPTIGAGGKVTSWARVDVSVSIVGGVSPNQLLWWDGTTVQWSSGPRLATSLAIGSGTVPTTGALRLANGAATGIYGRGVAVAADVPLLSIDAQNAINVGGDSTLDSSRTAFVRLNAVNALVGALAAAASSLPNTFGVENTAISSAVGKSARLLGQTASGAGAIGGHAIVSGAHGPAGSGDVIFAYDDSGTGGTEMWRVRPLFGDPSYAAFYAVGVSPSASNWAVASKGTTTVLNASSVNVGFAIGGNLVASVVNAGVVAGGAFSGHMFEQGGTYAVYQQSRTTNAATHDLTIQSQAPFAGASGANRNPGNLVFVVPAPAAGGADGKHAFSVSGVESFVVQNGLSRAISAATSVLTDTLRVESTSISGTPRIGFQNAATLLGGISADASANHTWYAESIFFSRYDASATYARFFHGFLRLGDGTTPSDALEVVGNVKIDQTAPSAFVGYNARISDAAAQDLVFGAQSAWTSASINKNGGRAILRGGDRTDSAGVRRGVSLELSSQPGGVMLQVLDLVVGAAKPRLLVLAFGGGVAAANIPTAAGDLSTIVGGDVFGASPGTNVAPRAMSIYAPAPFSSATGGNATGAALTIGGGPGLSAGVNFPGNTVVDLGVVVSNVSARFQVVTSTLTLLDLYRSASNTVLFDASALLSFRFDKSVGIFCNSRTVGLNAGEYSLTVSKDPAASAGSGKDKVYFGVGGGQAIVNDGNDRHYVFVDPAATQVVRGTTIGIISTVGLRAQTYNLVGVGTSTLSRFATTFYVQGPPSFPDGSGEWHDGVLARWAVVVDDGGVLVKGFLNVGGGDQGEDSVFQAGGNGTAARVGFFGSSSSPLDSNNQFDISAMVGAPFNFTLSPGMSLTQVVQFLRSVVFSLSSSGYGLWGVTF